MRLEKWALIAEIVGGLAILVTLSFLVYETRQNNELTRLSAYNDVIQTFTDWRSERAADPVTRRLLIEYSEGRTPPDTEESRGERIALLWVLMNEFANYERAYLAYRADVIAESEWPRLQRAICSGRERLIATGDIQLREDLFASLSDGYVTFIEAACQ